MSAQSTRQVEHAKRFLRHPFVLVALTPSQAAIQRPHSVGRCFGTSAQRMMQPEGTLLAAVELDIRDDGKAYRAELGQVSIVIGMRNLPFYLAHAIQRCIGVLACCAGSNTLFVLPCS